MLCYAKAPPLAKRLSSVNPGQLKANIGNMPGAPPPAVARQPTANARVSALDPRGTMEEDARLEEQVTHRIARHTELLQVTPSQYS